MKISLSYYSSIFFKIMTSGKDQRFYQIIFLFSTNFLYFSVKQSFKYLMALDFEAQCQQGRVRIQPQEIVEFPCILIDAQNFKIIDTFHQYIKVINL